MALYFADLVREACWVTGAGELALGGALPGHRTFAAAVPGGARFHYAICGVTHPQEWETGEGEIVGGALARSPIASSAGGAAVAFSAGLKTVALTANAAWFEDQEAGVGIADVDGLAEALAGKAAADHGHSFGSLSGRPTTLAGYGIADAAAAGHDHAGAYQPADSDLSAIAGLSTTAFGRAHLALADATALRGHAGLGGIAVQAADSVAITGGSISGIIDLAVADGGTGASSAPAARTNLGLGSIATQDAANVSITGGTIGGISSLSVSGAVAAGSGGLGAFAGDYLYRIATNADFTLYGGSAGGGGAFVRAYGSAHADKANMVEIATASGAIAASFAGSGATTLTGALFVEDAISIGGSQVVATRRTGWAAPSGTAARSGFDTASVTTEALAERVKALIDDLTAHGLIGS
ncbi:hypothetical protein [Sphingosinicella sp.]|uniref:hypothetical protein n=1 Tax=Sphingosinicella sp. TaxID=1917971 RepID=UPI004037EA50